MNANNEYTVFIKIDLFFFSFDNENAHATFISEKFHAKAIRKYMGENKH